MEFLDGETLAQRLVRLKPDTTRESAGSQEIVVASALEVAPRAGIVHRDLKPGNVMLTAIGAKLLDFGLAKSAGRIPGAPGGAPAIHLAALSAPMTMTSPQVVVFQLDADRFSLLGRFPEGGQSVFERRVHDTIGTAVSLGRVNVVRIRWDAPRSVPPTSGLEECSAIPCRCRAAPC